MKCPYCGVGSDVAHETQEACIAALHAEISRMREILNHVQSVAVPGPADRDTKQKADPAARRPSEV
ncbi:MAG: hypothetical protein DMF84_07480 [Acidobacteria bacterium]|nr:MAG: hypothetical protein DMF84_07480 [Acidobacteriota bacterium]